MQWREGWNIKPDVVIEMPKPYAVPASGTIEYTYFVVPSGFTKDTWVIDARSAARQSLRRASRAASTSGRRDRSG